MDALRAASELRRALERLSFHVTRLPRDAADLRNLHTAREGAERRTWALRREEQGKRQAAGLAALDADHRRRLAELAEEITRLPLTLKPRVGIVPLVDLLEAWLSVDLDWLKRNNPRYAAALDRLRELRARTDTDAVNACAELQRGSRRELAGLNSRARAAAHARAEANRKEVQEQADDHVRFVRAAAADVREHAGRLRTVVGCPVDTAAPHLAAPAPLLRLADARATVAGSTVEFPVLARFPLAGPLLITRPSPRPRRASAFLHQAILRMLLAAPPGRLLLSAADPVGLGASLAPFLILKQGNVPLLTPAIATSGEETERLLQGVVDHIEEVIQDRLGDRYRSVEEYNRATPELPVPYRCLLLCDVPDQVTKRAADLLRTILRNGPRCGVCVVLEGPSPADVLTDCGLSPTDQAVVFRAGASGEVELCSATPTELHPFLHYAVPALPPAPELERTLAAWSAAAGAHRIEVDYFRLLREAALWRPERALASTTAEGLTIPLGVAGPGAVRSLELGTGTSQHVLVTGKSGSGKSNLLHVLITTAARCFPPSELELLLIDFKRGVEFKVYDEERLPQARIVAVESDRELGLGALRQLRGEAERRGRLFRDASCTDVAAYRRRTGASLPRVLLVIDEFQLLFDPDDAIAQEARGILDHLVRQGRAFGIHVVLATQTLYGVWAATKSTLSQMAVRIALQCDDADSRLVLADNNPAAKTLRHCGEAILNTACGQPEANERYQVAWLPRDVQARALRFVRAAVEKRLGAPAPEPRVFDGRAFPDPDRNEVFRRMLQGASECADRPGIRLPLGETDDLTGVASVSLAREAGQNALLVGRAGPALRHLVSTIGMVLARPALLGEVREVVLYDPEGILHPALSEATSVGPPVRVLARQSEVCGEVLARWKNLSGTGDAPRRDGATLLVLLGLHKLLDLKLDAAALPGRAGSEPRPGPAFADLLHAGPEAGVYVLAWASGFGTLVRNVDPGRKLLRDFNHRVSFQVSEEDSLALLGNRLGSHLGELAGLHFDAVENRLERFRPFRVTTQSAAHSSPLSSSIEAI
jgi:hypothetical protein